MKVVIFGATGMVGKGVLLECLDDARVERILLVSRHPIDISHRVQGGAQRLSSRTPGRYSTFGGT